MKKLILLLLFIPLISFGQNFDYDDLKEIDSVKKFKKFAFENEFIKFDEGPFRVVYAYKYDSDNKLASIWAEFYKDSYFNFRINRYRDGSTSDIFNRILEQVKSKCTFFDILEDEGREYICYTCTGSAYPGKIGFARGDKSDFIETFPDFKFKS
jgi:hypothetical protein